MKEYWAGRFDELPEKAIKIVQAGTVEVGVLKLQGQLRAYENRCPHQGGPACAGGLLNRLEAVVNEKQQVVGERFSEDQFHIICPWHGWTYEAMTGACVADPKLRLVPWEVVQRDDHVYLLGPKRKR